MKKLLAATLFITLSIITCIASADVLTDYRFGHYSIFAGYWGNLASAGLTNPSGYSTASNSDGMDIAVATGLGHCLALRYDYSYLPATFYINNTSVSTTVQSHEIDLVFKTGNDVSSALGNLKALFSKDPFKWYTEPDGRNSLGLYIGARIAGGNSSRPDYVAFPADYVSTLIIGTYSSTQVSKHFATFGQIAVTGDLSLLGTAGLSYAVGDGVDLSVSYKYESFVNGQKNFYTKSGFIYGLNFQY